jgi:hypothetical protein
MLNRNLNFEPSRLSTKRAESQTWRYHKALRRIITRFWLHTQFEYAVRGYETID